MQASPAYVSLLDEVCAFFRAQLAFAYQAGIHHDQILLDPGIGFGKTLCHNLTLLQQLETFLSLGHPLLIGPSRKSFLGQILQRPVDQRLMGTAAAVAIAIIHGATIVRVHDVAEMVQVVLVAQAIRDGAKDPSENNMNKLAETILERATERRVRIPGVCKR
jgi:dihydropteroate synthase